MSPQLAKSAYSLLLLTCCMLLAGFTAQAQKGNTSSNTSGQRDLVAAPRPWTRAEMLSAKPMDMPAPSGLPSDGYAAAAGPSGAPRSEAGGLPTASAQVGTTQQEMLEEALFGPERTLFAAPSFAYPFPFSRYEVLPAYNYGQYPHRTVGKVFFTKFGGGNYVCSASSIGNYGVITAGHCVSDGLGHFHTNWVFIPRYYNGTAPDGQWSANHLWVRTAWHTGGGNDFQEDIGGAVLNKLAGLKISQRVGFLGWAVNLPLQQVWHSLGYPQAPPFNGSKQIVCATAYAKTDIVVGVNSTFGVGCDTTGGTSGGPLIRKFSGVAGATNYVNGVNSYKYTVAQPLALYSPYFGSNALNIINCLRNSGPGLPSCVGPPAL